MLRFGTMSVRACVAVGVLALHAGSALGQDCSGQWLAGYGVSGVNGSVNAMTLWDPDGAGPRPEVLVIGGSFTIVDKTVAANIAAWDGEQWTALGSGTNGSIAALASYGGKLYAAGTFTQAGGVATGAIAAWDGTVWTGTGAEATTFRALAVYQNELVAASDMKINGSGAPVAKWNGTAWDFLGTSSYVAGSVNALLVFEGDLIIGGTFTQVGTQAAAGVARWNGTWTALATGISPGKTVRALGSHGGKLYAGGTFTSINGVAAQHVARLNGAQWESAGIPYSTFGTNPGVISLVSFDGKLIAGGNTYPERAYAWDGQSWSAFGQFVESDILCLQPFGSSLYAGVNGASQSNLGTGLIRFESGVWKEISEGFVGSIKAMQPLGDDLVVGGGFYRAGDIAAKSIVRWNGARWSDMNPGGLYPGIETLCDSELGLFIGGGFRTSYSPANGVAKWNGAAWDPLGQQLPSGSKVFELTAYQGSVVAVGEIPDSVDPSLLSVRRWDGANWVQVGPGISGLYLDSCVVYNGELIVAGSSLRVGASTTCVLRYDGTAWQPLVAGLQMPQFYDTELFVHDGLLYIGGYLMSVGSKNYGAIASWNGVALSTVGGLWTGSALSMAEFQGDLLVGGTSTNIGGIGAKYLARWNGSTWSAFAPGLNGTVTGVTVWNGEVVVAGSFTKAGDSVSAYFARWAEEPRAWTAVQPESRPVNEGLTLKLSAAAASGYSDVSYQWKRDGVDVVNGAGGASAGGGIVSGASGLLASPTDGNEITLSIAGVQTSDAGDYTVVFTTACGDSSSAIAAVAVNGCPSDLNGDDVVDDADFTIFIVAYNTLECASPEMPAWCPADLNGDGLVDDADFSVFVGGYDAFLCE